MAGRAGQGAWSALGALLPLLQYVQHLPSSRTSRPPDSCGLLTKGGGLFLCLPAPHFTKEKKTRFEDFVPCPVSLSWAAVKPGRDQDHLPLDVFGHHRYYSFCLIISSGLKSTPRGLQPRFPVVAHLLMGNGLDYF